MLGAKAADGADSSSIIIFGASLNIVILSLNYILIISKIRNMIWKNYYKTKNINIIAYNF